MVSLGDNSRRSGGYFFDHDTSIHHEEEPLVTIEPVIVEQPMFKTFPTIRLLVIHILILVLIELPVILLPILYSGKFTGLSVYSWIILLQSILWTIFFLAHVLLSKHLDQIRLRGYLDFYRRFLNLKWVGIGTLSGGCAIMLVVVVFIESTCEHIVCSVLSMDVSPVIYVQILISIQVVLLVPYYIIQIKRMYQFNCRRYPPDAQREELAQSGNFQDSLLSQIGYSGREEHVEDVMERQLDVIRYLKQHNAILSRKIIQLSEQNDHLQRRVDEQRAFLIAK